MKPHDTKVPFAQLRHQVDIWPCKAEIDLVNPRLIRDTWRARNNIQVCIVECLKFLNMSVTLDTELLSGMTEALGQCGHLQKL